SAVSAVLRMDDVRNAEPLSDCDGVISGCVIDEQKLVDNSHRDFGNCFLERSSGVVGGKNDNHTLAVDHALLLDVNPVGIDARGSGLVLIARALSLVCIDSI